MSELTAAIIHFEALRTACSAALFTLYKQVEASQVDVPIAPNFTHTEPTTEEIA